MKKKLFNKLVRDNIINKIKDEGRIPNYRIMKNDEFIKELNKKLLEETCEFIENNTIEELADVFEVILKIMEVMNISFDEFERFRMKKKNENGGFEQKIYLIDVNE